MITTFFFLRGLLAGETRVTLTLIIIIILHSTGSSASEANGAQDSHKDTGFLRSIWRNLTDKSAPETNAQGNSDKADKASPSDSKDKTSDAGKKSDASS